MISVLLSVGNNLNYFQDAYNSIINQTFKNFQFVIVSDGLNKKSQLKLKKIIGSEKRVKLIINEKNIGLTKSLIKGMKFCKYDWIARIDSDDISEDTRLKNAMHLITKKKNIALIGTNLKVMHEKNKKIIKYKYPNSDFLLKFYLHNKKKFFAHSSIIFNKTEALKAGGYREEFSQSQDYDLWVRLSRYGKFLNTNKYETTVRIHEYQISKNLKNQIVNTLTTIVEQRLAHMKQNINFKRIKSSIILVIDQENFVNKREKQAEISLKIKDMIENKDILSLTRISLKNFSIIFNIFIQKFWGDIQLFKLSRRIINKIIHEKNNII